MRILGLDYGAARIGIALGDTDSRIASPWKVLSHPKTMEELRAELTTIIRAEQVQALVVGMPRRLHDQTEESEQARAVRQFVLELHALELPVFEENETWSTQLAARQMRDRGEKGKRDDLAAAVILQSYLDRYGVSA
jgi:putative Holliday junction resolvase